MFKFKDEQARAMIIAAYIGVVGTTIVAILAGIFALRSNAARQESGVTATAFVAQSNATQISLADTVNAPTFTPLPSQTLYPTYTFQPTHTPNPTYTPSIKLTDTMTSPLPALFETSFESGIPNGMLLVYGSMDFIDEQLLAHELTLLSIGDDTWKNYQVEYETSKHTYCWGLQNNGIAAHAIDQDNMVLWSWNYCETGWFESVNGDWIKITGGRDIVANPGTIVTIRLVAEGGNFSVYTNNNKRSSYLNEKYTQGKVYILLSDQSVIDNIRVSLLP